MLSPYGPLPARTTCGACKGSGMDPDTDETCARCGGSGEQRKTPEAAKAAKAAPQDEPDVDLNDDDAGDDDDDAEGEE